MYPNSRIKLYTVFMVGNFAGGAMRPTMPSTLGNSWMDGMIHSASGANFVHVNLEVAGREVLAPRAAK